MLTCRPVPVGVQGEVAAAVIPPGISSGRFMTGGILGLGLGG